MIHQRQTAIARPRSETDALARPPITSPQALPSFRQKVHHRPSEAARCSRFRVRWPLATDEVLMLCD